MRWSLRRGAHKGVVSGSLAPIGFSKLQAQPVEMVHVAEGPPKDFSFYVEQFGHEEGEAQIQLFRAEGMRQARPALLEAAEQTIAARSQELAIDTAQERLKSQQELLKAAEKVFPPYRRRVGSDLPRYLFTWFVLLGGDVAAITMASVLFGDYLQLSALQALAVGIAALAAGMLGGDLRRVSDANRRKKTDLTEDEKLFAPFFAGVDLRLDLIKWIVLSGLLLIPLIGGGVLALRASLDGLTGGAIYACFSMAVACGSWFNSWAHVDEGTEKLEHYRRSVTEAESHLREVASGGPASIHARRSAEAQSVESEYAARGEAARLAYGAAVLRFLSENPHIAGHGRARSVGSVNTNGTSRLTQLSPFDGSAGEVKK